MVKENKGGLRDISLPEIWKGCLRRMYLFVLSFLVCMGAATYYLRTTPEKYVREAAVLVKTETAGKNSVNQTEGFNELGVVQLQTNVNDVMLHLVSLNVLSEVAKRTGWAATDKQATEVAQRMRGNTVVALKDKKAMIVGIKYSDKSADAAEQYLTALVETYNDLCTKGKQRVVEKTSRFIENRLRTLEKELRMIDDSVSYYKSRYQITGTSVFRNMYVNRLNEYDAQYLQVSSQIAIGEYILDLMSSKKNKYELLPSNSGINDKMVESLITRYNDAIIQLSTHLRFTSSQNPLIIELEKDLTRVRTNITRSLENFIKSKEIERRNLQGYQAATSEKIMDEPEKTKHLISIEREQVVKENLYKFLLQKLEENSLSMTYTTDVIEMIDKPYGSNAPTSTSKSKILVLAFLVSLLLPMMFVYVVVLLDTKVRHRDDFEGFTSLPALAEIGNYRSLPGFWLKTPKKGFVVSEGGRDDINDSFRVLRNNLEEMFRSSAECGAQSAELVVHDGGRVCLFASNREGMGVTFITQNAGAVFAVGGSRVLVIDGDLRSKTLTKRLGLNGKGLGDYLQGTAELSDGLTSTPGDAAGCDVMGAGLSTAGPTELLSKERMDRLLADLRRRYDYIFIDCHNAKNTADAALLSRHADKVVFVVTAGKTERKSLLKLVPRDGGATLSEKMDVMLPSDAIVINKV